MKNLVTSNEERRSFGLAENNAVDSVRRANSAKLNLTQRQMAILRMLPEGKSAHEMANTAGITLRAVNDRLRAIYRILHVRDKIAAIGAAIDYGLLEPSVLPPEAGDENLGDTFSERQEQMLAGITLALANRQIADRLGIKLKTVHYHMDKLHGKMKVFSRYKALAAAKRNKPLWKRIQKRTTNPKLELTD